LKINKLTRYDCIYLFSDGYKDQINGETGKKYSTKLFKETIVGVYLENMNTQEMLLEKKLKKWKGNFKQIDDISVMGIRI